MLASKVICVGSSAGLLLPEEILARLKVKTGDTLYLTEAPDGFRLTPHNPEFERQMPLAEDLMAEDRDVLGPLAE